MSTLDKREFCLLDLKHWFEREKRIFPWRQSPTPYAVWVSEVMLQQTRASVVIPYFEKWMARFRSIEELAKAPLEEVIKLWEGLGYYSRARHLHEGAKYVMERYGGVLPEDPGELGQIKGLGPYTIGAIRSFAFHKKSAAVDGNVLRVMARVLGLEEEIDRPSAQNRVKEAVQRLLPEKEPWVVMEGLIELGATLCGKKPSCVNCPLKEGCRAYALGKVEELPKRGKRAKTILLIRYVALIVHEKELLLQKHEGKKIMADLFEFPYFDENEHLKGFYPSKLEKQKELEEVEHTFTRYRARLIPTLWKAEEKREIEGFRWVEEREWKRLPFSSGHRKILERYEDLTH